MFNHLLLVVALMLQLSRPSAVVPSAPERASGNLEAVGETEMAKTQHGRKSPGEGHE